MLKFKDLMERINETRLEVEGLSEDSTSVRQVKDPVHKQAAKLNIVKRGEKDQPQSSQTKFNHKSLGAKENSAEIHTGGSSHRGHKSEHIVNHILKKAGGTEPSNHDDHKQTIGKFNYHVKKSANGGHVIHITHATHQEEVDLEEGRMKDLAMDMESLSHADFKKKHKRSKQEMQSSLKSEGISLDELSVNTVRGYYNKAGEQGKKIADKMKMGGGDWSKDGSDTKTLKKRAAGRNMALKRRSGEVKMSEDAEQTDEALKGNQHKIDANKNGKVDGHDFKILRNAKKARYQ